MEPGVFESDPERLERRGIVRGGGRARRHCVGGEENLPVMARKMASQFAVGIGPVIEHQIELAEPRRELRRHGRGIEQRPPASFVLRVRSVDQAAVARERGGGGVAGQLDLRGRPALAQGRERR